MPRVADHDARRRQVAAAVTEIVATDGLDGVTVARTAAAAGISVGLVQHYFPSKDDMLLYAFTQLREAVERRADADVEAATRARARIEDTLLDALGQLLPLDGQRRRECRVTLAFTGRAVDNPRLAQVLRTSAAHLRARLAQAVHNGKECGEVPARTDPDIAALALLSTVDGLALQAYSDPDTVPPQAARAALATALAAVFPGPCDFAAR